MPGKLYVSSFEYDSPKPYNYAKGRCARKKLIGNILLVCIPIIFVGYRIRHLSRKKDNTSVFDYEIVQLQKRNGQILS